jgi:hypothetical protein
MTAGGQFTTAGGATANYIAKWDGNSWLALGSGMDNSVWALAAAGTDLYAAGSFWWADGVTVNRIAKWDGSSWSALGSGMNHNVNALALSGGDLYAGGMFTTAGSKTSVYLTKAQIVLPANALAPQFLEGSDFVVRFDGSPGITYTIEYAENASPANWQKAVNMTAPTMDQGLGAGVFEFRDSSTAAPHRFYRAVWPAY